MIKILKAGDVEKPGWKAIVARFSKHVQTIPVAT